MKELRDPMGLIRAAARVDPVLMQAARQVEAEMSRLRSQIQGVRSAWSGDMGNHPEFHRVMMNKLRKEWPVLGMRLDTLDKEP